MPTEVTFKEVLDSITVDVEAGEGIALAISLQIRPIYNRLVALAERWESYYPEAMPESAAYQEARRATRLRAAELRTIIGTQPEEEGK